MSKTKVYQVISVDGATLIIFVATEHCWQLGLISPSGAAKFTTPLKLRSRRGWSGA